MVACTSPAPRQLRHGQVRELKQQGYGQVRELKQQRHGQVREYKLHPVSVFIYARERGGYIEGLEPLASTDEMMF